jgi:hypothetical protein
VVIPVLEFSKSEIIQLLVSQPIQITPEWPLQAIIWIWDLVNQLISTRELQESFCNQVLPFIDQLYNVLAKLILRFGHL